MKTTFRILLFLLIGVLLYLAWQRWDGGAAADQPADDALRGAEAVVPDAAGLEGMAANRSGLRPGGETADCQVERIIDGDTIHCPPVGRIRLIGIDTPERGQQPFGPAATQALTDMTPIGSSITVEFDVDRTDRYDRILGYLWAGGELVNWRLVREGWALMATYPPNVRYTDHYLEAQQNARTDGVGLWAVDGFACEPAAFRRGDCG
ncbi:MAG: thermonuclease family protein [Bacteroidetes bacterium]|nr:thermonuclease family protein [Bacteroidota bacterium]